MSFQGNNSLYCFNPACGHPINQVGHQFCQACGQSLRLQNRYSGHKILGQGGFGRTILGIDHHRPSQPACVIKQFFPQGISADSLSKAKEMFIAEAQQLDNLGQHAQIPDLYAYFEQEDQLYIVQEFIPGDTLTQCFQRQGCFSEIQIKKILINVLPIIDFIHNYDVIHRDIKPDNIIIHSQNHQLYLVDFGAAKSLKLARGEQTGTVIGTTGFAAPEQLQGKAIFASDLYGLGVTCLYLLVGEQLPDLYDPLYGQWSTDNLKISASLKAILQGLTQYRAIDRVTVADKIMAQLQPEPPPTSSTVLEKKSPPPPVEKSVAPKGLDYPTCLKGENLSRAALAGANLHEFDLQGTNFTAADLSTANLSGANLTQANLRQANLNAADLSQSQLHQANLSGANLTQANFTKADLSQANLAGADLDRANLWRADLNRANLQGANLITANLRECNLAQARYDSASQFPPGFVPQAYGLILSK